ncbi:MAG: hypothetical protein KAJ19_14915 [Gammaproteobacteria bacterium]|nr:hypothetical protein [Gammaproteobacteria bacterium]
MVMTDERRMALAGIGPIRMTLNERACDFESCLHGWQNGQALCALDLDLFFAVSEATVIEVIPKRRPGMNTVKISKSGEYSYLNIDGERWQLYMGTVTTAELWIDRGFNYVQIEVIE